MKALKYVFPSTVNHVMELMSTAPTYSNISINEDRPN